MYFLPPLQNLHWVDLFSFANAAQLLRCAQYGELRLYVGEGVLCLSLSFVLSRRPQNIHSLSLFHVENF